MNKEEVRIYSACTQGSGFFIHVVQVFQSLYEGRDLAWRLASRDIRAMYRQSLLGILWAFILPLVNALTWLFLRGSGVVQIEGIDMPYTIYVFSGTMLWAVLTESVTTPLQKTVSNKSLLSKINFPREALMLSAFYQVIFNTLIKTVLVVVVMMAMGYNFFTINFIWFPVGLLALISCGLAIGIWLTPVGVLYGDITRGIPIVFQFAMYLSPVVFAVPKKSWVTYLFEANPFTPLLINARNWITGSATEVTPYFLIIIGVSLVMMVLGLVIYRLAMPILIERMSS